MATVKGFYHLKESYYYPGAHVRECEDELMIGLYGEDGDSGTEGEFAIRWYDLGDSGTHPKLEVFSDAWQVLNQFAELFSFLEIAPERVTPKHLMDVLKAHGYKDFTKRISPHIHSDLEAAKARVKQLEQQISELEREDTPITH